MAWTLLIIKPGLCRGHGQLGNLFRNKIMRILNEKSEEYRGYLKRAGS